MSDTREIPFSRVTVTVDTALDKFIYTFTGPGLFSIHGEEIPSEPEIQVTPTQVYTTALLSRFKFDIRLKEVLGWSAQSKSLDNTNPPT